MCFIRVWYSMHTRLFERVTWKYLLFFRTVPSRFFVHLSALSAGLSVCSPLCLVCLSVCRSDWLVYLPFRRSPGTPSLFPIVRAPSRPV